MKTALVTGASGFLGTNLCLKLLEESYSVIGIDNFKTGKKENLTLAKKNPNFSFTELDVKDHLDFEVDLIFNLACPASPEKYQNDPIDTMLTCVIGTLNCLNLAKRNNAILIHASTSEIYGDPKENPQTEKYYGNVNPYGPRSCYDEGKRAAESLAYDHTNMFKTDCRIVRIFNTYGPFMSADDGRVVSNFINQALKKQPITIYGDGNQTRSFCYVDDLIDGMFKLSQLESYSDGPMNLGNDKEFTLMELFKKIESLIGHDLEISYLPLPINDPKIRRPDIKKAKSILDWKPKINLDEGLKSSIKYFEKLL